MTNSLFKLTDEYQDMDQLLDDLIFEISLHLRDRESVQILRHMYNDWVPANRYEPVFHGNIQVGAIAKVKNGEISALAGMKEIKLVIQTRLEELFNIE